MAGTNAPWPGPRTKGPAWKLDGIIKISANWSPPAGRPSRHTAAVTDTVGISKEVLARARLASWERHGQKVEFFLPGMFLFHGETGLYPAVSLTGQNCALNCEHCRGVLLKTMIPALDPDALVKTAKDLATRGRLGMLISGGSDLNGRLPWDRFYDAIKRIVDETGLIITVHAGYLGPAEARKLKAAGVSQALVDVIGDHDTARNVYHLQRGTDPIWETLDALAEAGLEAVPHLVAGLDFGRLKGEPQALDRLATYRPKHLVIVVLSPKNGTPMKDVIPPAPEEVAEVFILARELMPQALHHLGCARPRGKYGRRLDVLALQAGVNAVALPSDDALAEAERLGLETRLIKTCCSLAGSFPA